MKEENKKNAIKKIGAEIEKIGNKTNKLMFYVLDTEGYASGSLAYEYQLAKIAKDAGYNVSMIYQSEEKDDKFVGVGGWLGDEPDLDPKKRYLYMNFKECYYEVVNSVLETEV